MHDRQRANLAWDIQEEKLERAAREAGQPWTFADATVALTAWIAAGN